MPAFVIDTNIPKTAVPAEFLQEATKLLSEQLGKPETFVAVHVNPDQMLMFGGTSEPAALCSVRCIGKLGLEENQKYTQVLMEKMNKDLGIPPDRIYINFIDMARQDVGWNSKTFASK